MRSNFARPAVRFGDSDLSMPLRETAPKLLPEQYEKNFAEIAPALNPRQAAIEAARCLYCFDAPCTIACPTHIDVPAFIKKISTGNLLGSARTILSANILGHSCGRVCPTEVLCEGACVMHEKGEPPIEIGRLQRYAVDHVLDNNIQLFHAGAPNGKKVACIGSGPASLACAAELAKWGYDVTIFDRNELPGGLNTYGIAAYKARAKDAIREADLVKQLGVKFRQKVGVGRDISFADLEKQFDAIFIGVGLGETWSLSLPGEDLHGVYGAIEFLAKTKVNPSARSRSRRARRLHRSREHRDRRCHRRAAARRQNGLPHLSPRRGRHAGLRLRISARQTGRRRVFSGRRCRCASWAAKAPSPASNACGPSLARRMKRDDARRCRWLAPNLCLMSRWWCAPWGSSP